MRGTFLSVAVLGGLLVLPAFPQEAQTEAAPGRRRLGAITYPEDRTVRVALKGTARLPGGTGEARVRRRPGITEIELKLDGMKPAISFGGDFNTYVLWAISPEGITFNTGELVLRGARSELRATTSLGTFGMFVTAEPHFLVQRPSAFFVLENTGEGLEREDGVLTTPFEYDGIKTGYAYKQPTLAAAEETRGWLRTDRYQAIVALRLAEKAGARTHAQSEFSEAQTALNSMEQAFAQRADEKLLALFAYRAVRLAVHAGRVAEERAAQQALEAERARSQETIAQLRKAVEAAEASAAVARDEAKRARAAADKVRKELEETEEKMLRANLEADRLARQKLEAEKKEEAARREAAELYARLEGALSRVADTRETLRGLIVNLPDILFDSGKATLRPRAREILSRIAGILLVVPEYRLSIEGHTDSVGRAEVNQRLSEERAQAVRDYLVEANVAPALITTRGFGESQPVASNQTAAGRQQNRRVEIIIEGLLKQSG